MCFRRPSRSAHLALSLLAILAIPIDSASGRTWYIKVDGTGDAPTIQAGVDLASPGDIVLVGPGIYADTWAVEIDGVPTSLCVEINKDIQLVSEQGPLATTIGLPAVQVAIYIHDAAPSVSGFRVETRFFAYGCVNASQLKADPNFQIGIKCRNFSGTLSGNHVVNHGIGIELTASPAVVTENEVTRALYGVRCNAGSDAQIEGNVFHDCGDMVFCVGSAPEIVANDMYYGCSAIYAGGGSSPTVKNNTIHETSPYGIVAGGSGTITVENNRFTNTNLSMFLLDITGTAVVRGNLFYNQGSGAVSLSDNPTGTIIIEANTIDRTTEGAAIFCQAASSPIIRRNIIVHSVGGVSCVTSSFPTFECNNIFDAGSRYAGTCSDQTGVNGNISADPQFCGAGGSLNYALQSDSPCAPGNHPDGYQCGGIGAFGVGCGTMSTKKVTWGAIKAMYR